MSHLRWAVGVYGVVSLLAGCEGSVASTGPRGDEAASLDGGGPDASGPSGAEPSTDEGGHDGSKGDAGSGDGRADAGADGLALRFYSVLAQQVDPRFAELPRTLPIVRLLPSVTLQAEVAPSVKSVRLTVDGTARLDASAPFRFTEDDAGAAVAWDAAVGVHSIKVETYASADGSGEIATAATYSLELTADGSDPTPAAGEHSIHRLWIASTGAYVHKSSSGDFVDPDGKVVLQASDVSVEDRGGGQLYLVSKAGLPTLDFAFIVLLPDGFDENVAYPLLLLLHHGSEDYRGTDSDDSLLAQPPLVGDRSLVKSALRHAFPAIVVVPQLHFHGAMGSVKHEWAAFTSIDGEAGNSHSAAETSVGATYALGILDDMIASTLTLDGKHTTIDPARLYMTGHSMGGLGTWDLVARKPDFWAAAVPMAGYPDHDKAAALVNTPIWAFHHKIDCYNKFAGSETMHRLITEAGGQLMRLSALDFDTGGQCDQAHFQTPDRAFADVELLPWMFSQVNGRI